jgi:hypothetical protein
MEILRSINLELNSIWIAPNALQAICNPNPGNDNTCSANVTDPDWNNVQSTMGQILTDIKSCQLPQVSWVIPDQAWSDHPGTSQSPTFGDGGPSWAAAIVNAVGGANTYACTSNHNQYWPNTVVLITWDDWGGWVDHVPPYNGAMGGYQPNNPNTVDGKWFVYGFRVPLLVVSPYTSAEYVSGPTVNGQTKNENPPYVHDFGSILGFVEAAFSLSPYNTPQSGCGIAGAIDPTNGCTYPFADYFAPDGHFNGCSAQTCQYPLADFFNLSTPRTTFPTILGAKYGPNCFTGTGPTSYPCFGPNFMPGDPDNDGVDTED